MTPCDYREQRNTRQKLAQAWLELRLAASFLTVLPVSPRDQAPTESVARALRYFPLVGYLIGVLLVCEDELLSRFVSIPATSALLVASLAVVSGMLHLDGLADTADALSAYRNPTRALEIMHDSRTGSYGVVGLCLILLIKYASLAGAANESCRRVALYLAPAAGRTVMVVLSANLEYLRSVGAGSSVLRNARENFLPALTIFGLGLLVLPRVLPAIATVAATAITTLLLVKVYRRWLGGITGDMLGAASEIAETLVLLVVASLATL